MKKEKKSGRTYFVITLLIMMPTTQHIFGLIFVLLFAMI